MDQVIEDLKSISGVLGGFLFSSHKGIIANNLPSIFKIANLKEIANMVMKIYSTGNMNFKDITEISLYYEESILVTKEISDGLFLIVLADPASNINLLTISMNLISENISKIDDLDSVEIQEIEDVPVARKNYSVEEVMELDSLSTVLNGMKTSLAKIMGPMARIIFDDAMEEWLKTNDPTPESIPELLRILNDEIGAKDKINQYQELIAPYMNGL